MSKLNVGTLRPSEAFTVPKQSTSTRNNTDHQVGSIIYNTDTNSAQVLTANNGWLNMGKGKVTASGGTETTPGDGFKYHAYTQTGNTYNFNISSVGFGATIELLVVAGGGGGGGSHGGGGGGGGGGVLWQPQWFPVVGDYQVRVGAGGLGGPTGSFFTNGYYYTGQGDGTFFHGRRGEDSYIRKTNDSQITFLAIGGGGGMESFYTNNEQRTKTTSNYWSKSDGFEERDGGSGGGSGDHYSGVQGWESHNTGGRCTQGNFGGYGYGNSGGGRFAWGVGPHNGPYNRRDVSGIAQFPEGVAHANGGFMPRYRGMNGHGQDTGHGQPHEAAGGGGAGGYELGRNGSNTDYGQVNWPALVKGWSQSAPGSGGPGRYFPGFEAWGTTEINGTSGDKGWFGGGGDGGQYYYTTNGQRGPNNKGGGGGQGSHYDPNYNQVAGDGLPNTGGGGGGGSQNNAGGGSQVGNPAGSGGSGIVLIRYKV